MYKLWRLLIQFPKKDSNFLIFRFYEIKSNKLHKKVHSLVLNYSSRSGICYP